MLNASLLLTIFLGALVSGWHCALMCGGIAAALERPSQTIIPIRSQSDLFYHQLIMHCGRLTTYILLGALAAWLGVLLWEQDILPIQRPLFALAGVILMLMGYRLIQPRGSRVIRPKWWLKTTSQAAEIWAKHIGVKASNNSRWFSGIFWGLVPCGLVYSILPLAFLSGNPLSGAGLMLAFGLGTLPNLLLISRFSASLAQFGQYRWVRYFTSLLMISGGAFSVYRAWSLPESLLKGGFCLSGL
ncbi:MAG: sulfite exporter TauE/SafE family protein [Betaproteobacteria bacterium]|jgi:sulfite exporter TauE/SafE